mgnify:CR=1 FL=1
MSYFLENEEVEKVEEVKEQDGIASIEPLLDNRIVRAIREMGFEKLSPIQEQAIPYLLQGEDIIGQAQTGTGKTAAFGIPAIQHINPDVKKLQTIILCPTRELAIQAAEELRKIAKYMHGIKVLPVYGGQDISRIDPETLLTNYSVVFQEVVLFNASIMDNIRIGKRDATDEEVRRVARLAQCDEFVTKMPQGYQTIIGENGETLSGGERQRISIARAFLKNAPILLLDESTASLDADNEAKINQALDHLMKGKTVFVIAHRLNTIQNADQIIVLNDGKIEEMGTHEELMEKKGYYYELVKLQTGVDEL